MNHEEVTEFSQSPLTPTEREQVRELLWDRAYREKLKRERTAALKVYGAFLSAAAAIAGVVSLVRDLISTKPH